MLLQSLLMSSSIRMAPLTGQRFVPTIISPEYPLLHRQPCYPLRLYANIPPTCHRFSAVVAYSVSSTLLTFGWVAMALMPQLPCSDMACPRVRSSSCLFSWLYPISHIVQYCLAVSMLTLTESGHYSPLSPEMSSRLMLTPSSSCKMIPLEASRARFTTAVSQIWQFSMLFCVLV